MIKRGLFIGLTTFDIQHFVDKHPEPNTKVKTETPEFAAGGPAAMAAITFAYLGGETDFFTCIGQNPFREFLLNDFAKNRVRVFDAVENEVHQPVISSIVTNISDSHRTIFTHYPDKPVEGIICPEIDPDVYGFVFIDGFYPEIAMPILQQARAKGIEVVFDGGSWKPHLPDILPFVDYAICSDNFHPPGCDTYQKIFDYILDQGVKEVAITRGEDNILTPEGEVGIDKVIAVDSLGAGDILHGAFCWYMLKNNSFLQAITNASKVATFSTIYKGTRRWMDKMNFKYKEN